MEAIFATINEIFSFIIPLSDLLWEFPTNFSWYAQIPILGNFSLAIILLLGSGVYFSFRLGFVQISEFSHGVLSMVKHRQTQTGISPLASFFLSSAMRVGPGNIIGVTGAISVGGPGALFWMWVSAFFGMSIAYMESVLAQIFKEQKGSEFVGGLPFYGRLLLGNHVGLGIFLSMLYILYAWCCLPAQAFNVVSSVGEVTKMMLGREILLSATFYYITGFLLIFLTAIIVFGGIRKVIYITDKMVPVMAVVYTITVIVLICVNFDRIPYFFSAVFRGAFTQDAVFGGTFGTVLAQGVKRGLMSNEAGQGTITMSAAAAAAEHPCEQGNVAALGVFLDTIVICTLTGFVVIMPHCWSVYPDIWNGLDKLPKFLFSVAELTPGTSFNMFITFLITCCFGMFAYTTLLGMISFSEIAANRISKKTSFINLIRILSLFVAAFGILCNIVGLELSNLWAFSDLGNIIIVYFNIPILYLGAKLVFKAYAHYKKHDGTPFTSKVIGIKCTYWDQRHS